MTQVFNRYESINAFLRELETSKTNKIFEGACQSKMTNKPSWRGTSSYDVAQRMIIEGDDKSAKMLENFGVLKTPKRTIKNRSIPTTNVFGYMPHIPNYLAGLPNNMITNKTVTQLEKIVTIVIAIGTPSGWSGEQVAEVNARIVTAIKMLEASGTRVNLYVYNGAKEGNEEVAVLIKLKDSGRYMQVAKMAYCLINPSMHRRHFFRYRETRKELTDSEWCWSYGATQSISSVKATLERNGVKYDYLASTLSLEGKSAEEIQELFTQK